MEYKEIIYKACTNTDFNDKNEAISLAKFLANEAVRHMKAVMMYEDKLKETMSYKDFDKFLIESAKKLFHDDIDMLEESDFKEYVTSHLETMIFDEEGNWEEE